MQFCLLTLLNSTSPSSRLGFPPDNLLSFSSHIGRKCLSSGNEVLAGSILQLRPQHCTAKPPISLKRPYILHGSDARTMVAKQKLFLHVLLRVDTHLTPSTKKLTSLRSRHEQGYPCNQQREPDRLQTRPRRWPPPLTSQERQRHSQFVRLRLLVHRQST